VSIRIRLVRALLCDPVADPPAEFVSHLLNVIVPKCQCVTPLRCVLQISVGQRWKCVSQSTSPCRARSTKLGCNGASPTRTESTKMGQCLENTCPSIAWLHRARHRFTHQDICHSMHLASDAGGKDLAGQRDCIHHQLLDGVCVHCMLVEHCT